MISVWRQSRKIMRIGCLQEYFPCNIFTDYNLSISIASNKPLMLSRQKIIMVQDD